MKCLYVLVAFIEDENVPVTIPSIKRTRNPNKTSLAAWSDPFNSEKRVKRLLG